MRFQLAVIFSCAIVMNAFAQSSSKGVNVEVLRKLIGNELQDAGIAFVGDDVRPFLDGSEKGLDTWGKINRKTDIFIVFSEEIKTLVERKSNKRVVFGGNIGSYFNHTWRGQDFLTWIKLTGNEVTFVETVGRPVAPNSQKVQSPSDTMLASFVTDVSRKKDKVEVLVVGTQVSQALLDSTDLTDEFKVLDKRLSYVIVPSQELKLAFSSITSKEIYVKSTVPEPGEPQSVMDRMKWMIVEAQGADLIRVRGSGILSQILTPRSERGKPQE